MYSGKLQNNCTTKEQFSVFFSQYQATYLSLKPERAQTTSERPDRDGSQRPMEGIKGHQRGYKLKFWGMGLAGVFLVARSGFHRLCPKLPKIPDC